jgi:hypothetical protein
MTEEYPKGILEKLQKVRQPIKKDIFHRKFNYDNYLDAHAWLDAIFKNGLFVEKDSPKFRESACMRCGGRCCNEFMMVNGTDKELPTLVWGEHVYFKDPEFRDSKYGYVICGRKDKINCNNKLIICKLHPFYPAKIHILEEECDYSVYISNYSKDRAMCTAVEYDEWQIKELSLFFRWLYGEYPENRLVYIAHFAIQDTQECISKEKVHDAFLKGYECSVNRIYRP